MNNIPEACASGTEQVASAERDAATRAPNSFAETLQREPPIHRRAQHETLFGHCHANLVRCKQRGEMLAVLHISGFAHGMPIVIQ